MAFLNLPSARGAEDPVSGADLPRSLLRRAWALFTDSDDDHAKLKKPDDTLIDLETGGGGGGGVSNPLTEDLDTGGFNVVSTISDDPGSELAVIGTTFDDKVNALRMTELGLTLESDLDIAVHATVQDINVTADAGDINVTTDPDNGGNVAIDAGGRATLKGRGSGTSKFSTGVGDIAVSAATFLQLESGFGVGAVRMLENGSAWWILSPMADGDLDAGSFGFWFDPSNGAAKFKIKGKTLDGTVVTAEIPMAP